MLKQLKQFSTKVGDKGTGQLAIENLQSFRVYTWHGATLNSLCLPRGLYVA